MMRRSISSKRLRSELLKKRVIANKNSTTFSSLPHNWAYTKLLAKASLNVLTLSFSFALCLRSRFLRFKSLSMCFSNSRTLCEFFIRIRFCEISPFLKATIFSKIVSSKKGAKISVRSYHRVLSRVCTQASCRIPCENRLPFLLSSVVAHSQ